MFREYKIKLNIIFLIDIGRYK